MYIFGGEDLKGNTNDMYKLDFNTLKWEKVKQGKFMPSKRSLMADTIVPSSTLSFLPNPSLMIFGGYTDDGFSN